MKKDTVRKILIIISIIIIGYGIILGISISSQLINPILTDNQALMIDGSDFSFFVKLFGSIGMSVVGILIVLYSAAIVLVIWAIYGIILLITKIIDKSKMKEENKKKVKKYLTILIILLTITTFTIVILNNLIDKPRKDYRIIEEYVLHNYNIELTTQSMRSMDRGDIGINPGKSYTFTMKDNNGIEYIVFVDTYDRNSSLEEILSNPLSIKEFNINKK